MKGKRFLCAMLVTAALVCAPGLARAAQRWVVTSPVAPVFENLEAGKAAPDGRWDVYILSGEEMDAGLYSAAYGDTLEAEPAGKEGWLSLKAGPDGSEVLGFVEQKLLTPMPEYDAFEARPWQVKKDGIVPFLLPGRLPLSDYSKFSLSRGAVVTAIGQRQEKDGLWVLCTFETDYRSGVDREALQALLKKYERDMEEFVGSDSRCAWLRAEDLVDLAASKPNLKSVEAENLPAGVQGDARKFLLKNGFYIDPKPLIAEVFMQDDMVDLYDRMDENTAKFITADLPMHVFHLCFDRSLQKLEKRALLPRTFELLRAMGEAASSLSEEFAASDLGKAAMDNVNAFIALGMHLLTNGGAQLPETIKEFAAGAMQGNGALDNPFTELPQDLSLFGPRGHYTLDEDFESYFRTTYLLGTPWPLDTNTGAAATLVLCRILKDSEVQKRWHDLVDPVTYLVGSSNVNTVDDLAEAIAGFNAADLGREDRVQALLAALNRAAKNSVVQKQSGRKFAVLPRRITFDAMIFDALTFDATSTPEDPRILPDPLDVMAVLGSSAAQGEVKQYEKFKNYAKNRKAMMDMWDGYAAGRDGNNVYTDVLKFLRAYLTDRSSKQFFANSPAWEYKKLITAEGVMTELKHDTILYAEQGGAEMGDGGGDIFVAAPFKLPIPRSCVEPVPALYRALAEASSRLQKTLVELLPDENREWQEHYAATLATFAEEMRRLTGIADRAVADAMTYEDFLMLLNFRLPSVLPEDIYQIYDEKSQDMLKMALVADVATSWPSNMEPQEVLFMATGTPRKLSVYVNDKSGGFRVTEGYMFSWYTFTKPAGEQRTNDDQWKALVYDEAKQDELKMHLPRWQNKVYE